MNQLLLEKGLKVRVSNGCPRPPEHHTRKLTVWRYANFTGTVLTPRAFGGLVEVRNDELSRSGVTILAHVSPDQVSAIE